MKATRGKIDAIESGMVGSVQDAIALMGENLVAWRQSLWDSPTGTSEQHLESFLIIAHEGYRQMAIKELQKPRKGGESGELISGEALNRLSASEDIAQQCVLPLIKRAGEGRQAPFNTAKIDVLLAEAKCAGAPLTGKGSPLSGYLYRVLLRGMWAQVRLKSMKTSRPHRIGESDDNAIFQVDGPSDRDYAGPNPDNVVKTVSKMQNLALATKVHDDYLDTHTYRGQPLREVYGAWTPMGEWTGLCSSGDRPSRQGKKEQAALQRSLQRNMKEILHLYLVAKNKTKSLSGSSDESRQSADRPGGDPWR